MVDGKYEKLEHWSFGLHWKYYFYSFIFLQRLLLEFSIFTYLLLYRISRIYRMEKKLRQQPANIIKVVLFGPESTGKTTLSNQLATHYNTVWAPEFAREYLQKKWNQRT